MSPAATGQVKFDPNIKDEYKGPGIVITVTIFTILITLSTGTRIISKLWVKARLRADDYLILAGFVRSKSPLVPMSVRSNI